MGKRRAANPKIEVYASGGEIRTSQLQTTLPPKAPLHTAARCHGARDMPLQMLIQGGPPGHELEAQTVVDHGKAAGSQRDSLSVGAGDMFAPCAGRYSRSNSAAI